MRINMDTLASASKHRTRGANNPLRWQGPKIPFVSTCPRCDQQRSQHAYNRRTLCALLDNGRGINAYCSCCNVCWPISDTERHAISP